MSGIASDSKPVAPSNSGPISDQPQGVRARYFNVYRLASYCLVLFTLGHTLGAVVATPRFGPESDRVVSMMQSVHVVAKGTDCTWYGFYRGFGWIVSVFLVLSVVITWHLGGKTQSGRAALNWLSFSMFLSHAASCVLTWMYFFPAPRVLSTAVVVLLGMGCIHDWNAGRKSLLAMTAKDHRAIPMAKEVSNG